MSETVKLVIEIPKEVVKWFKEKGFIPIGQYLTVDEAMKKAKPLSEELAEIREEIKALDEGITSYDHDDPWIYKREALEVIDKHISEEGDSE